MNITSPIFRFITIRAPQVPTDEDVLTGFVRYDPTLSAPLFQKVAAARNKKATRPEIRQLLKRYQESPGYFRNLVDLKKAAGPMVDFGDWLARNQTRLTTEDVTKYLAANSPALLDATQAQLWENLLVYTFIGGATEVREAVIVALRAAKASTWPVAKASGEELRRLARATVLLPASVQINGEHHEHKKAGKTDLDTRARQEVESLGNRLESLHATKEEVSSLYRDQLARERAKPIGVMTTPPSDKCALERHAGGTARPQAEPAAFDGRVMARVSEATRKLLDSFGISAGSRVAHVLSTLDQLAIKTGQALGRTAAPFNRVVAAGGSLWAQRISPQHEVPHDHAQPPREGRVDQEYSGMYEADGCRITPVGIADFRRVEQEMLCYEPGEVAHIENVLVGETRERGTRFLRRTESTFTTEESEETTKERDTQTTDRFEIEKEVEKTIKDDVSFLLGVQIAGKFGVVNLQTDTKFAYAHSSTESDKSASKYAKEITDRTLEKVVKKVREERIQRLIEEYEETNKHSFVNGGPNPIVGLYRWVDKVSLARVVNYDKRLTMEFSVPEPAAFHLHALTTAGSMKSAIEHPIDPRSDEIQVKLNLAPLKSHKDVNTSNFAAFAAAYNAKVEPQPEGLLTLSRAYNRDGMDHDKQFSDSKTDFKLVEGYEAAIFSCVFGLHSENHDGGPNWITVVVGQAAQYAEEGGAFAGVLDAADDFVAVTIMGRTRMYGVNLEVVAVVKPSKIEEWQIKTFNAILQGYQDKLAAYQTALAEAKAQGGSTIRGTNPLRNRQIEAMELKKGCIRLMDIGCDPVASEAMKIGPDCDGYPEFDCCEALQDAKYIQFVEQAFEWGLMTYLFYPYFWGRKCNWTNVYQSEDPDLLFLNFLQAGYARVVVPVRPGYEEAVMRFLVDGVPWNGGSAVGVESPLYLAIANEMKEAVGTIDPTVEPWEIRVPTTLTVLQCDSGCVEGKGLPCRRDELGRP